MPHPINYITIKATYEPPKSWEDTSMEWIRSLPHRGVKFWLTLAAIVGVIVLLFLFIVHGLRRSRPMPAPVNPNLLQQTGPLSEGVADALKAEPIPNKLVLIDTDAGVDDAWALILMIKAHQNPAIPLTIVGITTVTGNTHVDNVIVNVLRVLELMSEKNIPVYKGADKALVRPLNESDLLFFGKDGFGDAYWPRLPQNTSLSPIPAAAAILQIAGRYSSAPEKLTILALGPLTNIATAFQWSPQLKNMVKDIYFLGGNWEGMGNIGMAAEFNAFADAEAVQIVLDNVVPLSLHIIPWEVCFYNLFEYSFRFETMGNMGTKEIKFLNKIEATQVGEFKNKWISGDSLAAALLLEPTIAVKTKNYFTVMELKGNWTRGMMVVDRRPGSEKVPQVNLTITIQADMYKKMLIWAAGGPFYKSLAMSLQPTFVTFICILLSCAITKII